LVGRPFKGVQVVPLVQDGRYFTVQVAYRTHPRAGLLVSVRRPRAIESATGHAVSTGQWQALARVAVWHGLSDQPNVPPGLRVEVRVGEERPDFHHLLPLALAIRLAAQGVSYPSNARVDGVFVPGGLVHQITRHSELAPPKPFRSVTGNTIGDLLATLGGAVRAPTKDTPQPSALPANLHAIDVGTTRAAFREVMGQYAVGRTMEPPLPTDWEERVKRVRAHIRTVAPTSVDDWMTNAVAAGEIESAIRAASFASIRFKPMVQQLLRSKSELEGWRLQWLRLLTETVADAAPRIERWSRVLTTEADREGLHKPPAPTSPSGSLDRAWLIADAHRKREIGADLRTLIAMVAPPVRQRPRPYPHNELRIILDPSQTPAADGASAVTKPLLSNWGTATVDVAELSAYLTIAALVAVKPLVGRIETGRQYVLKGDPLSTAAAESLAHGLCARFGSSKLTEVRRLVRCSEDVVDPLMTLFSRLTAAQLATEADAVERRYR
jgi:hypothetical protein